jgi:hypothetical protein
MWLWIAFGIALLIAVSTHLWLEYLRFERALAGAAHWSAFEAKLHYVEVSRVQGRHRWPRRWRALIYATFTDQERTFGVTRVSFARGCPAYVRSHLRRLTPGTSVTVYADPERPHENMLIAPSAHRRGWLLCKATLLTAAALATSLWIVAGLLGTGA